MATVNKYQQVTCPPVSYLKIRGRHLHSMCWDQYNVTTAMCTFREEELSDPETYKKCKDNADRVIAKCMDEACSYK